MSSEVFLLAMIAAIRATPITSPFFAVPEATSAKVSGFMRIFPTARARRFVSAFAPTSTICALPAASKCVSSAISVTTRKEFVQICCLPEKGLHRAAMIAGTLSADFMERPVFCSITNSYRPHCENRFFQTLRHRRCLRLFGAHARGRRLCRRAASTRLKPPEPRHGGRGRSVACGRTGLG